MKRREFFQQFGGGSPRSETSRLEFACDLLQVNYAQALLENRGEEFVDDLRRQIEETETVVIKNEGFLRGETLTLFGNLFGEYAAKGKRLERRRN